MICSNRLFAYYWGSVIAILPFYVRLETVVNLRMTKDLFLMFTIFLSLILFGIKRDIFRVNWKIPVIFAYGASAVYFNQWHGYAEYVILHFFYISMGMLLCIQMICNFKREYISVMLNAISFAIMGESIFIIVNTFGIDPYENIIKIWYGRVDAVKAIPTSSGWKPLDKIYIQEIIGSLGNKHVSGSLIAIGLPALFRKKWLYLMPFSIYSILMTNCATPVITAIVAVLAWLYFRWFYRIKVVFLSCFAFVCVVVTWSTNFFRNDAFLDNSHRFKVWFLSLTWFSDLKSILFGRGPAYFRDKFTPTFHDVQGYNKIFSQAHNEYVELYVMGGIIGLILLIILLMQIDFKKNILLLSCLVAACANMIPSFPLHISSMALIIVTCYSLTIKQKFTEEFSHGINLHKDI